jgi:Universal stress protein UspA and related nucleotide-binding proteins
MLETLGVSYNTDVVQGNPASTVVDYADKYDQDLIVMPTHGREGISRYLIGSVSETVVRLSSVPVLTVRMQPDETLAFPYENSDRRECSRNARSRARALACGVA